MKTKLVLSLMFCSVLSLGQTGNPEGDIVKLVRVNGNAANLATIAVRGAIGISHFEVSEPLHAIVLRGKASAIASVESTIHELDAISPAASNTSAKKNVELTTYVIGGSMEPIPGTQEVTGETLAPVIKQLLAAFPYKHYQLLSTMIIRSGRQPASTTGIMKTLHQPPGGLAVPVVYKISFDETSLSGDSSPFIHLGGYVFSASVPYYPSNASVQQNNLGIRTDVDLREGQKVVVGNVNVADADTCLFLVLSAKLVP